MCGRWCEVTEVHYLTRLNIRSSPFKFVDGRGVAEDSAVSPLAVKQNGAIIHDSLLVDPFRVTKLPKGRPAAPIYPNMRISSVLSPPPPYTPENVD